METIGDGFGPTEPWVELDPRLRAAWTSALTADPPGAPERLGSRAVGVLVTEHRTSWVRRCRVGTLDVFAKTYAYPSRRDRLRGALRTTFLAPGRAVCESRALRWLLEHGIDAPRPLGVAEHRRGGWLRASLLVTEAWPGEPLDAFLVQIGRNDRRRVLAAVWGFVATLHGLGFVDRNLDPRNLLVSDDGSGAFRVTKIDSPRARVLRPGRRLDQLVAADRERLTSGLAKLPGPS